MKVAYRLGRQRFRANCLLGNPDIAILLFASIQSLACNIPVGKYKLFTESHWGVNLEIKQNNSFTVIWGAYLAGQPETLETKTYQGKW